MVQCSEVTETFDILPHIHPWSDSDEELYVRQTAEADPPDLPGLLASLQAAITIFGLTGAGREGATSVAQTP